MVWRIPVLLIVGYLLLGVGVADVGTRQPFDIRGGTVFYVSGGRCTIGAAVEGGYVTAGHCGGVGDATRGHNQAAQGVVRGSIFPGDSMAWVSVNSDWIPRPVVNGPAGADMAVAGSREAPVGATVCHSGSTTGWRCGILLQRNVTVRFPHGSLHGLIATNICSEPGDSGAPLMWKGHVQGILVGASGSCVTGGRSYYRPINKILQTFGLTLLTAR